MTHHINVSDYEHLHEYEAAVDGATVITTLTNAVNGSGEKAIIEGFARELACSHRTLQASAVRVMLKGLVKWASDCEVHGNTDMRNEAAVKLILKLRQTVIDTPVPFV